MECGSLRAFVRVAHGAELAVPGVGALMPMLMPEPEPEPAGGLFTCWLLVPAMVFVADATL